jgi:hypothetical protein
MAIARCEVCSHAEGLKKQYPHEHAPVEGLANRRPILCGGPGCKRLALIWLTDEEEEQYRRGGRDFTVLRHNTVQVK